VEGLVGLAEAANATVTVPLLAMVTLPGTVMVMFWPEMTTVEAATPLTVTSEAVTNEGTVVPRGKLRVKVLVPETRAPYPPTLKVTVEAASTEALTGLVTTLAVETLVVEAQIE